jgi:hypothetical protein
MVPAIVLSTNLFGQPFVLTLDWVQFFEGKDALRRVHIKDNKGLNSHHGFPKK